MFVDLNFVDDEFSRDFTLPFLQNLPFADIFSDAAKRSSKIKCRLEAITDPGSSDLIMPNDHQNIQPNIQPNAKPT